MIQEITADPMAHALYFVLVVSLVIHVSRDICNHAKIEKLEQFLKERDLFIRQLHAENFRLSQMAIRGESGPTLSPIADPKVINLQHWKKHRTSRKAS